MYTYSFTGTEDYPFQIATIKAMMNSFNVGNSHEIDFEHFGHVWRYVDYWQTCFKRFDVDKSGAICAQELNSALTTFGYNLSETFIQILIQRFDRMGKQEILFDDFIRCCLILHVSPICTHYI